MTISLPVLEVVYSFRSNVRFFLPVASMKSSTAPHFELNYNKKSLTWVSVLCPQTNGTKRRKIQHNFMVAKRKTRLLNSRNGLQARDLLTVVFLFCLFL